MSTLSTRKRAPVPSSLNLCNLSESTSTWAHRGVARANGSVDRTENRGRLRKVNRLRPNRLTREHVSCVWKQQFVRCPATVGDSLRCPGVSICFELSRAKDVVASSSAREKSTCMQPGFSSGNLQRKAHYKRSLSWITRFAQWSTIWRGAVCVIPFLQRVISPIEDSTENGRQQTVLHLDPRSQTVGVLRCPHKSHQPAGETTMILPRLVETRAVFSNKCAKKNV